MIRLVSVFYFFIEKTKTRQLNATVKDNNLRIQTIDRHLAANFASYKASIYCSRFKQVWSIKLWL